MEHTNEQAESTITGKTKKVERIARQSKELIDDVKGWIDLKIELVELEIQEKIKARQGDAVAVGIIGLLGVTAVVFLLVALALGLGAWLGHPAWGYLMTAGILVVVAGLLYALRFARRPGQSAEDRPDQKQLTVSVDQKTLAEPSDQKQLPAGSPPADTLSPVATGLTDSTQ